jgi:hypothetical protein
MWGPPLLGGLASQNAGRFTLQYEIINCMQLVAVPLIVFGAAETAFERYMIAALQTPGSTFQMSQPLRPRGGVTVEAVKDYLRKMRPVSFSGHLDTRILLQAPRAFVAPTTVLLFLLSFIPYCSLWALSESLGLLFSIMPWLLPSSLLGTLMAGPFVLSVATVSAFAFYRDFHNKFNPAIYATTIAGGTILAATGILAFGLDIGSIMIDMPANEDGTNSIYAIDFVGGRLSFPLMSILLGFIAAGAYVLDATVRPTIWRSTQFTSSNLTVCLRNVVDMDAGVICWRNFFAGVFLMSIPNAVSSWEGLKAAAIGLGVTQMVLAGGLAALWWFFDENIRRMDGRVMGLVDLSMLKRAGSFFDHD